MANGIGGNIPCLDRIRFVRPVLLALATMTLCPLASPAMAGGDSSITTTADAMRAEMVDRANSDFKPFYATRGWKPLWVTSNGEVRPAAAILLRQVEQARIDGLKPSRLKAGDLGKALNKLKAGDSEGLAKVELAASKVFVNWVKALRAAPRADMIYESAVLSPVVPTTMSILQGAAKSSLDDYVANMGWMHPYYAPLRGALLDMGYSDDQRRQLASNLVRVRALPAYPADRYVLVDAAGARLWMFENGKPVDSMKVVVGKADNQTPMMAGFLRYAIMNPYWNVPDDLVRQRIAWNVLNKGTGYLRTSGYQVLESWEDDAPVLDPETVDWTAVQAGTRHVRVRQLPGGTNFMGKMKFMFPNAQGIYLHDTPEKNLMLKDDRQYSSGCVRLEDAARLGRWLMGKPLPRKVTEPEQRVELPEVVPLYITYLTAFPEAGLGKTAIAFRADPYGRDGPAKHLATLEATPLSAR